MVSSHDRPRASEVVDAAGEDASTIALQPVRRVINAAASSIAD